MGVPGFFLWLWKNYKQSNFVFQKEKLLATNEEVEEIISELMVIFPVDENPDVESTVIVVSSLSIAPSKKVDTSVVNDLDLK